jgi:hypothetical protein
MARETAQYDLSDAEKRDLIKLIGGGTKGSDPFVLSRGQTRSLAGDEISALHPHARVQGI